MRVRDSTYLYIPITQWKQPFYTKERGNNDRYWGFGSIFGWQQDEYDVHKFGYYFELLRDILENAGFEEVENLTNAPDSREQAPHHLEVRAMKVRSFTNPQDSKFFRHFQVEH